ncbi:MAG: bifunctional diaminohydroxyphosphoribosylaminopyrimidine deaminase/5-amino-6-(5-phosphoribosylamino)uracil reductase RibD, partial [Candidatus Eremiobacteraeota bacterium]|nr:bifunctional diaminohydroxyphosphoribosylaminopyrimidine deaminase/5-amino-6-(5-phosphoribosylamino)uracil reductase RibD [Candidatus Eremiobacteraeota bacterium]
MRLEPREQFYLDRARELAARGVGNTTPNPAVGAVIVRDGVTLGEGHHRVRGGPHAEVVALDEARRRGRDIRGATLFVTLEPCNHYGLTPPCSDAVVDSGIARAVVGVRDPNLKTKGEGIARLRTAGIAVDVVDDPQCAALIEPFSIAIRSRRPYVTLKMAASLDGYVAPRPGSFWLTSPASRERVRELRIAHDAVMVGAGTVRIDDPQLTVRPIHARRRPYARVIVCEDDAIAP